MTRFSETLPVDELVRGLHEALSRAELLGSLAVGVLGSLQEKLAGAEAWQLEIIAAASRPARVSLGRLLETLDEGGGFGPADDRELSWRVAALGSVADRVLDPGFERREAHPELCVEYARVDLAALLRALAAAFEPLSALRGMELRVIAPEALLAEVDAAKLERVVLTLLFNAFKYTPEGGVVECTLEARGAGEVLLSVADTGPSIPAHQAMAVFDRSRQLDRSAFLDVEGVGFGLGTSRDFVALHGGTLEVLRRRNEGAVFRARIPVQGPRGIEARPAPALDVELATRVAALAADELRAEAELGTRTAPRGERPLVLIVEDSRSVQRVLTRCLEPLYNTVSAFDGAEGLKKAMDLKPDLLVSDMSLPEMDGEAMIRSIRAARGLAEIPILVLTGNDDPERMRRLVAMGVEDVVRKPFLLDEFRMRARNLVATKQARDVLRCAVGQREADLVKLADEVSWQKGQLEATLAEVHVARAYAEAASRVKSNFLRMMSHELKTPLTAIQLHMSLLERDPRLVPGSSVSDRLAHVARSTHRLIQLVDTVIEWARAESGRSQLAVEPVDLEATAEQVMAELRRHAAAKGLTLAVRPLADPAMPSTDPAIVRLLLMNLVMRAIQQTNVGVVEVAIDAVGERHRMRITDGAKPTPAERRDFLFDPLRADHDLRWHEGEGSGLGLHVACDIARSIDAEIVAEELAGGGNVVSLLLPSLSAERTTARVWIPPEVNDDLGLAALAQREHFDSSAALAQREQFQT